MCESCGAGAVFCGADLRSVDFTDARLVGVMFCDVNGENGAIIDGATLFSGDAMANLTDVNRSYVKRMRDAEA